MSNSSISCNELFTVGICGISFVYYSCFNRAESNTTQTPRSSEGLQRFLRPGGMLKNMGHLYKHL